MLLPSLLAAEIQIVTETHRAVVKQFASKTYPDVAYMGFVLAEWRCNGFSPSFASFHSTKCSMFINQCIIMC
jgi:hypothetical protein